jgi:hypothetical protein
MSVQHGRVALFLAPPTVEEAGHLGTRFDISEEAMRRLRDPFQAGPMSTERARRADGDAAAPTSARS